MELGLCAPVDQAREAREAGFDYLECRWRDFAAEAPASVQFLRGMLT
ncbi:MAG: hypothetical protein KGZ60_07910 [Truepera sp.]|nr:hypothetical protein [Truepera sp.]